MKKVLVVCPNERDKRELQLLNLNHSYDIYFQTYPVHEVFDRLWYAKNKEECEQFDIFKVLQDILLEVKPLKIDGVFTADDYPGSILSSFIAKELGLIGPSLKNILLTQHKYYSRCLQKTSVPSAIPSFTWMDPKIKDPSPPIPFPFFMKPAKSIFSSYAYAVKNLEGFQKALKNPLPPEYFLKPFNELLKKYTAFTLPSNIILVEGELMGSQCTLSGYVQEGVVHCMGIVDAIMYPNTQSFERFEYPSSLPQEVQHKIENIAKHAVLGLGLESTLFNIEFMIDPKSHQPFIIEVNTRMSSQDADLFEKVDGINSYEIALQIATGKKVRLKKREGQYNIAASSVLRTFRDAKVLRVPTKEEIENTTRNFPELRLEIFGEVGDFLSEYLQDTESFRYALIHLGGETRKDLLAKLEMCKTLLPIQMEFI